MIGVAGGVKRDGMLMVGEDVRTGVTGEERRDGLGSVVAAGWLPAVEEEMVEAVVLVKALTVETGLDRVLG